MALVLWVLLLATPVAAIASFWSILRLRSSSGATGEGGGGEEGEPVGGAAEGHITSFLASVWRALRHGARIVSDRVPLALPRAANWLGSTGRNSSSSSVSTSSSGGGVGVANADGGGGGTATPSPSPSVGSGSQSGEGGGQQQEGFPGSDDGLAATLALPPPPARGEVKGGAAGGGGGGPGGVADLNVPFVYRSWAPFLMGLRMDPEPKQVGTYLVPGPAFEGVWWPVWTLARTFGVVVSLAVPPSPSSQLLYSAVVIGISLLAHLHMRAHTDSRVNKVEVASLTVQLLTIAILLSADASFLAQPRDAADALIRWGTGPYGSTTPAFAWVVSVNVLFFAVAAALVVREMLVWKRLRAVMRPVYQYLFGVGMFLAFVDGFGIGANDNANNFANAVASKVVTPLQAVLIAAVFEFLGAVLVGNNVAESIRGRIINVSLFKNTPTALQLGMVCALMGSSTWLMLATKMGWPVSTTHSIIGAVLGMGLAAWGPGVINWEYGSGRGFAGIVASWFISIAVSGLMAAALYLVMKYAILRYKNSFQRSLIFGPVVFGLAYGIMALAIVWKGTPKLKLDKIPDNDVIAIVLGVWAVTSFLTYFWVSLPLKRMHWDGQDVQRIDFLLGPFAPKRSVRPDFDASHIGDKAITESLFSNELDPEFYRVQEEIQKYNAEREKEAEEKKRQKASKQDSSETTSAATVGVLTVRDPDHDSSTLSKMEAGHAAQGAGASDNPTEENPATASSGSGKNSPTFDSAKNSAAASAEEIAALKARLATYEGKDVDLPRRKYEAQWRKDFAASGILRKLYLLARYVVCWGIDGREVVESQAKDSAHLLFAPRWENKTEKMYVTLNAITSAMQSFAHGSNDVANAIGPLATIYFIYQNNKVPGSSAPVELWVLAYGGGAIVLGLLLYGFNIMRVLGNNLTYQSPTRGFCMDVGSAITILIASKEGFPISTTQALTGATVGVGLANGEWKAVNWLLFGKIFLSWALTLPVAGLISGCMYAFIAYSPKQPHDPAQI